MSAIARLKNELAQAHTQKGQALKRIRDKGKEAAQANEHTLMAVGASFAIGMAEEKKWNLPTIKHVDPKVIYGFSALGAAYLLKDRRAKAAAQSVADGLLSISAYEYAKKPKPAETPATTQGYGEEIIGDTVIGEI